LSAEAAVLLELGTQLYDRLGVLAGHAEDLRRALERTVESYNRFAGSLEGRVLVTARRFPGVDADALSPPSPVTGSTRRFTAEELTSASGDAAGGIQADLGELRERLISEDDERGEVRRSREPR
jgi:DNA recombination protein RmuC